MSECNGVHFETAALGAATVDHALVDPTQQKDAVGSTLSPCLQEQTRQYIPRGIGLLDKQGP